MSGEQRLSDFDKGYEAGYRDAAPPPVQAGLLDRFIETAEGPVLVMDGNHVRGPATAFELDLRAALLDSDRLGLDAAVLAEVLLTLPQFQDRDPTPPKTHNEALRRADAMRAEAYVAARALAAHLDHRALIASERKR